MHNLAQAMSWNLETSHSVDSRKAKLRETAKIFNSFLKLKYPPRKELPEQDVKHSLPSASLQQSWHCKKQSPLQSRALHRHAEGSQVLLPSLLFLCFWQKLQIHQKIHLRWLLLGVGCFGFHGGHIPGLVFWALCRVLATGSPSLCCRHLQLWGPFQWLQ